MKGFGQWGKASELCRDDSSYWVIWNIWRRVLGIPTSYIGRLFSLVSEAALKFRRSITDRQTNRRQKITNTLREASQFREIFVCGVLVHKLP
jgi:hypothetical protein